MCNINKNYEKTHLVIKSIGGTQYINTMTIIKLISIIGNTFIQLQALIRI